MKALHSGDIELAIYVAGPSDVQTRPGIAVRTTTRHNANCPATVEPMYQYQRRRNWLALIAATLALTVATLGLSLPGSAATSPRSHDSPHAWPAAESNVITAFIAAKAYYANNGSSYGTTPELIAALNTQEPDLRFLGPNTGVAPGSNQVSVETSPDGQQAVFVDASQSGACYALSNNVDPVGPIAGAPIGTTYSSFQIGSELCSASGLSLSTWWFPLWPAASPNWSTSEPTPGNSPVSALSCTSSNFCMIVDGAGVSYQSSGPSWSGPDMTGSSWITSLSCTSATFCVAVTAQGTAMTFNGTSWSAQASIDPSGSPLTDISCSTSSFCIATDFGGNVFTDTNGVWSSALGSVQGTSVSCAPSASFCMTALGTTSYLFENGSWSPPIPIGSTSGSSINSLSCPTSSFCVAVTNTGEAVTTNYVPSAGWVAPSTVTNNSLTSVSCTSPAFCVAIDNVGEAFAFTGTQWTSPASVGSFSPAAGVACSAAWSCLIASGHLHYLYQASTALSAGSDISTAKYYQMVHYTASLQWQGPPGLGPAGIVAFKSHGTTLCNALVVAGTASCSSDTAPVGSDVVSATYAGDSNFAVSSAPAFTINVQAVATGYYEVASDGGIFSFGPGANYYGSMGGKPLNAPIVGIAAE